MTFIALVNAKMEVFADMANVFAEKDILVNTARKSTVTTSPYFVKSIGFGSSVLEFFKILFYILLTLAIVGGIIYFIYYLNQKRALLTETEPMVTLDKIALIIRFNLESPSQDHSSFKDLLKKEFKDEQLN